MVTVANAVGDTQTFIGVDVAEVENASGFSGIKPGEDGCRYGGKGEAEKNSPVHAVTLFVVMVDVISGRIIRIKLCLATKEFV